MVAERCLTDVTSKHYGCVGSLPVDKHYGCVGSLPVDSAPNLKAMDNISAQHPAQSVCDARRVQRRARREQRKALVLALVQRLLDLDSAEQGERAAHQAGLETLAAAVREQASTTREQQALLQAALQARLAPAPAPALPHAQRSEIASRPVARNGGSALEGGGSAAGEPAMGATGVITSGTRATPGRSGNFDGRERASALGTGGCAAPAACAALASAPRTLPQTPSGPGRSRVGVDRGAAHPLLERVPHAGAFPTAPPIPRAAQASPGGMSCRALHGGLHDREPGDWRAAEGAARDARPAWDDTVALHAECRQRTPSPDPGLAPPHGPQAILSEALRRREALQRRMLATPQGLAQRGHPGSPRVAWQQARGAEAAAQQRCWGEHLGHAGASSEDRAGVRWRSPVRRRQGAIPEPSLGAVLHQLDALETRMAGLVGRAGAQLGGLDCNSHHRGPPESASPPRPASPAPVAAAAQAAACRKEGTQAEAAALPTCSADRGVPEAGAVDPGACATATAAGSHAGVLQTGRAGQPFGSGDRGVCSAAGVEQARVSGAGASDCAAELQAESPKRFPEQEGCAHAGGGDESNGLHRQACAAQQVLEGAADAVLRSWGATVQELLEAADSLCEELFAEEFL